MTIAYAVVRIEHHLGELPVEDKITIVRVRRKRADADRQAAHLNHLNPDGSVRYVVLPAPVSWLPPPIFSESRKSANKAPAAK